MIILKKLIRQIRGFFPSRLPMGVTEFENWVIDFENTYNLPTKDKDSIRFALASMILNLGTTIAFKSKFFFYLSLSAGAAKQVAGSVFYEIKTRQAEAVKNAKQQ